MSLIRGKRIPVTGGAGFLGQPVCQELKRFSEAGVLVRCSAELVSAGLNRDAGAVALAAGRIAVGVP